MEETWHLCIWNKIVNYSPLSVIIFFLLFGAVTGCGFSRMDIRENIIPEKAGRWESEGPWKSFCGRELFNHINGGAELYLTYEFKEVKVKKYTAYDGSFISLEIYNMGNSGDAYGIFSVERDDEEAGIGQGSEYGGGMLRFWKGRYFVSITTTARENEVRPEIFKLAQIVESAITKTGPPPPIVKSVPVENLKGTSYFHRHQVLNRKYYLSDENILLLDDNTESVLAEYHSPRGSAYLLRVEYPHAEASQKAYSLFKKSFMEEAGEKNSLKLENGRWILTERKGSRLSILFDSPDKKYGEKLLSRIKK
jgi:hypothetical protein